MNVSAKTEYACIAVLELAASYGSGEPVRVRAIADTHGIPSRFLVQILLQLKGAGLVSSTRGASGGYQLIKDPATITLFDVMSVVDGQPAEIKRNAGNETSLSQLLVETLNEVANAEREMLCKTTLAELGERAKTQNDIMYYI